MLHFELQMFRLRIKTNKSQSLSFCSFYILIKLSLLINIILLIFEHFEESNSGRSVQFLSSLWFLQCRSAVLRFGVDLDFPFSNVNIHVYVFPNKIYWLQKLDFSKTVRDGKILDFFELLQSHSREFDQTRTRLVADSGNDRKQVSWTELRIFPLV